MIQKIKLVMDDGFKLILFNHKGFFVLEEHMLLYILWSGQTEWPKGCAEGIYY